MYDLLILGALLVHDRTGYKLRRILEGNLDPRRQISNGIMYPLLHKLAEAGYLTLTTTVVGGREQKLAAITDAGRAYFDHLMHAPIPLDAKREATYRYKFRAMGRESVAYQRELLTSYQAAVQADLAIYQEVIGHLQAVADRPERQQDAAWSQRTMQLNAAVAQAKLDWAAAQLATLPASAADASATAAAEAPASPAAHSALDTAHSSHH